jgi:hypothetical protein
MARAARLLGETDAPALAAWTGLPGAELADRAEGLGLPALVVPVPDIAPGALIEFLIGELQTATRVLYTAWLPGAAGIDTPGGSGREAVAALARAQAARTELFGPYLEAIADAALCKAKALNVCFPPETAFRECFKLFCRAYKAPSAVLILETPGGASNSLLAQLQDAALFITAQRAFAVWLAGDGVDTFERIPLFAGSAAQGTAAATPALAQPHITPLAGRPNPLSSTENRVEAFLTQCEWAHGRAWNHTWSDGPLMAPIRVDLIWACEKLIVEFDGLDHLTREKYARDRARDRALQAAGFAVLRFTNQEIADDLSRMASEIERFLTGARS